MSDSAPLLGTKELDDETANRPMWLGFVQTSVARLIVTVVSVTLAVAALLPIAVIFVVPRPEREKWAFDTAYELLRTTPPTDEILRQLPTERLASVIARGEALVSRTLTVSLVGAAFAFAALGLGYALAARIMRRKFARVALTSRGHRRHDAEGPLARSFAGACFVVAIVAHLPYATQSLRFDEDSAALHATHGWMNWANNLEGWQHHVSALLAIRISTAIFGVNEFGIRLPAVLASSAGLACLCGALWRRGARWTSAITAAIVAATPVWAEQTSLARGYGLAFMAASMLMIGMMRLDEDPQIPSTTTVLLIGGSGLIGCTAHFFFTFLFLGACATIATNRRMAVDLRWVLLWSVLIISLPAAVSLGIGAPAIGILSRDVSHPGWAPIAERFSRELSWRQPGLFGAVLATLSVSVSIAAAFSLPRRLRMPCGVVAACTFGMPLLAGPVYLYPRFFLHSLVFIVPAIAHFLTTGVLRWRTAGNVGLLVSIVAIWVSTNPWDTRAPVDLRRAAIAAKSERERLGDAFAVDTFLSPGIRVYNGDAGRIVNTTHPIPDDLDRILIATPHLEKEVRIPAHFRIIATVADGEHDVILVERNR